MPKAIDLFRVGGDYLNELAARGRFFYASDADQNDLVTGQTSFAATTPTFLVRCAADSGQIIIPAYVSLHQSGVVAGGAIDVIMEIDNADRFASGGTEETVLCSRTDGGGELGGTLPTGVTVTSNPTAGAGYGVRTMGLTLGQDVSPAEGIPAEIVWTPPRTLDYLKATATIGGSWLIYTYAGTTGPTWFWTLGFAVAPIGELHG
jgi:hypothetical protein